MFGLGLIQLEGLSVVLFQGGVLIFFVQDNITNNEQFCLCAHKATKGIVWGTNNRLTAHVKAGIHNNRATGGPLNFVINAWSINALSIQSEIPPSKTTPLPLILFRLHIPSTKIKLLSAANSRTTRASVYLSDS